MTYKIEVGANRYDLLCLEGLATLIVLHFIYYISRDYVAGPTMTAAEVLPSVGKCCKLLQINLLFEPVTFFLALSV